MASQAPRVSLGMPVYNAERFLREVLDSIVAQTFTNWELIISDNGSLDATGNICREYAARDSRVQYHANDGTNHGPAWNYNRTEALARGDLFKWAAADDLLAPRFLEQCVAALDANPDAVMASPLTRVIDEDSKPIRDCKFMLPTDSPKVGVRFGSLINVNHKRHEAFEIFALIRTSALRSFPRKGAYARADSVVLARLSLFGRFHQVQEVLFLNRDHRGRSVRSVPSRLTRGRSRLSKFIGVGPIPPTEWWDASKRGKICFPEWKIVREYWRSPSFAPLTFGQRLKCYGVLASFTVKVTPKLCRDLIIAGEEVFWRLADQFKAKPPAMPSADNLKHTTAS